ncbi:MAG: PIG-L family deacetylase [Chloroflexi bacterium]|nr:PIG-L family deacetylase [Chloroflexota bacterium]
MRIVVFSPHPDDAEVLMGGTIARYAKKGHDVLVVVVTIPNQRERRVQEATRAAGILGARISILDIDPYKLAFDRKLVETLDGILRGFPPDVIYTSWINDSHQDHVCVARATIAAARKNYCPLYMYEQAMPSGVMPFAFKPQVFVDISDTIETKIKSVLAHESQFQSFSDPWIEGIRGRAAFMGFRINVEYAEAFEVVKDIKQI